MSIDLVCGKREEGKSTRALSLAREFSPRMLILDHRNQFDIGVQVYSADELQEALEENSGPVVYELELDVAASDDEEIMQVVDVVREVWARGRDHAPDQRFTFIIDEAGELSKSGIMARALHRMIRQVRLDTVKVILTCHRPKDISTSLRSVITDLYLFNITDPLDQEWLRQAGVSQEDVDFVAQLPRFHHVHLQLRTRDRKFVLYDKPEEWRVQWEEQVHAI